MCGYCIESGALEALFAQLKGAACCFDEPIFYLLHLQEAADWRKEVRDGDGYVDASVNLVILCQYCSDRLDGACPLPLTGVLGETEFVALERWLGTLEYPPEWRWALAIDAEVPSPLPIDVATSALDLYINAWLKDPCQTTWTYQTFHDQFLRLFIALELASRSTVFDSRLEVLALSPIRAPLFNGLDLWLQRRALRACVNFNGMSFIRTHLKAIRIELIGFLVLGMVLSRNELIELRTILQSETPQMGNVEVGDVLEAIDLKLKHLSTEPLQLQ